MKPHPLPPGNLQDRTGGGWHAPCPYCEAEIGEPCRVYRGPKKGEISLQSHTGRWLLSQSVLYPDKYAEDDPRLRKIRARAQKTQSKGLDLEKESLLVHYSDEGAMWDKHIPCMGWESVSRSRLDQASPVGCHWGESRDGSHFLYTFEIELVTCPKCKEKS